MSSLQKRDSVYLRRETCVSRLATASSAAPLRTEVPGLRSAKGASQVAHVAGIAGRARFAALEHVERMGWLVESSG